MKHLRSLRIILFLILSSVALAQTRPATPASADSRAKSIPELLKPWENWVTWKDPHRDCPTPYNDAKKHLCFWPSRLSLKVEGTGARFELSVSAFAETWVPLPGGGAVWPVEVKDNGAVVPVVEHDGHPSVRITAGTHRLEGAYRWSEMPQRLPLPQEIGLLALTLDGQPVESPSWDAQGILWLKRSATSEEADKDFLSVKIYSALEDGIPLWWRTEVELTVSGKSREEELGTILPEGWKLAAVESPIPVAVDDAGRMKAQVRAGKWTVRVDAFRLDNAVEIKYAADAKRTAAEQLFAFRARPDFRMVEIVGAPSIDVSQTTFPNQWRELPVYRWDTATPFRIEERMRGMGDQKPAGLTIAREWWLDENGRGLTFRDQITGQMQQIWRLDAAAGQDLGSVRSGGQGQLITRNPQNQAPGVEIRTRAINLEATGRMERAKELPATGWRSDADALNVTLNLPPGWRLFALFGADWVHGDWLTAWTLLDLFLLLIFSLAVFRLWGFGAAVLAFVAFGLSYHEPGAPRYIWLILLVPLALLRVVPEGWGKRVVGVAKWVSLAVFILILAPFLAGQVQQALYPQLEQLRERRILQMGERFTEAEGVATAEAPQAAAGLEESQTDRMQRKLERIVIPKLELREATVRQAVDILKQQSVALDTESPMGERGVNIVMKVDESDGAANIPGLEKIEPARITVSLTNIPLIEALRYVTGLANLKFKVEAYAVSIVPQSVNTDVLVTKEWVIPPNMIPTADATASKGSKFGIEDREVSKNWLIANGVQFNGAASAVYIVRSNRLIVRNTQDQIDLLDTIIAQAKGTPASRGSKKYLSSGDNLAYDSKARIQTGPGVPEWKWREVSFGWNGPVQAAQQVRPILISLTTERVLSILRIVLLLALAAVLLNARQLRGSVFRGGGKAAAMLAFVLGLSLAAPAGAQFPEQQLLDQLRERLLEKSDAFPTAADIPSVALTLKDRRLTIDSEVHAATRVAVPLPGRLPAWSPVTVFVDDKPEASLRRDDGYLWVVLAPGVHRVRVEGMLAGVTEWEWTFQLKPRRVTIDAPGWTVSGVRPDGTPEQQVFFALQQKAAAGQATYERQDLQTIVVVDRHLELGLIWQVRTTVTRLSPAGKAIVLRIPLLPGENVLSANAVVRDGSIEVRLSAQEQSATWESGLTIADQLALAARAGDTWVERWHLIASPVWNVALSGLAPIFEPGNPDLVPVWQPWPGESVQLAVSRPEAIAGATVTVSRGTHEISLGKRQRVSKLDLTLRCSLGEDFLIDLPAAAEITALTHSGKAIPVRKDGSRLIVPLRPGEQAVSISWKSNDTLGFRARGEEVRLPVESANIHTIARVPENRWVLWAAGPLRGPAVQFWVILICSLLAAAALARVPHSPLRAVEWMLLAIGLTQVPLLAALTVVGWLFFLVWRGRESFQKLKPGSYNFLQIILILLTAVALGILLTAVGAGLLGSPEMFIRGNGSTQTVFRWFQPRNADALPQPEVLSISIWWYRFLMLVWALWLAAALIRWLRWGWENFSGGGCIRKPPKAKAAPPPAPPAPPTAPPPLPKQA